MALYYPLCACLTLFANTLQNPQDSHAASDIKLMELVTGFIARSVVPGSPFAATLSLRIFKELTEVAGKFVENTYERNPQKMKRMHENKDHEQGGETETEQQVETAQQSWLPTSTEITETIDSLFHEDNLKISHHMVRTLSANRLT